MYKHESCLPSNSKFFRQNMCTWWKRERYMTVHPPDINFSGQMPDLNPAPYPIGLWNEWSFNMNNMESTVLPSFENNMKFYKSSRKNDKTSIPQRNKISEQGFQMQGQVGSKLKPVNSTYSKQHGQFSPSHLPPRFHTSFFKQQGQFCPGLMPTPVQPSGFMQQGQPVRRKVSPPVQNFYRKPHNNSCSNSNNNASQNQVCRFCLQNGEEEEFCSDHRLKDQNGKVTCPILRRYVCDLCNATGDFAHTRAYCPLYKEKNKKPLAVLLKQTCHDSSGRIRK